MGKASRKKNAGQDSLSEEQLAKKNRKKLLAEARRNFRPRTFEGLPGECDLVAMREIVPAATASLKLTEEYGGDDVLVATILPAAAAAMKRQDGVLMLGLQVSSTSPDISADLASSILAAKDLEPSEPLLQVPMELGRPRLQDIIDPKSDFSITVHTGFDYWMTEESAQSPELQASLDEARQNMIPTERLATVEGAYWCRIDGREHLRWVLPQEESKVLDAMGRLQAKQINNVSDGGKYLGAFRTHGVVVPVWDLAPGTSVEETEDLAVAWHKHFLDALADDSALNADERRARAGIVARQLTLR